MSSSPSSGGVALEQTHFNESATFLGLPREIRNIIYHHIFPKLDPSIAALPSKIHIQAIGIRGSDRPHYRTPRFPAGHGLAALMINRQVRDEIIPVFYSKYHFTFYQDRQNIPKAITWLKSLRAEQQSLVQLVTVYMREFDALSPVAWMNSEEEHLSRAAGSMQVKLAFRCKSEMNWWSFAYKKCAELRDAGKSWRRIEARKFDRIQDEWEDRLDAGLESESDSGEYHESDRDTLDDDEYDTDIEGYGSDESMPWQETM